MDMIQTSVAIEAAVKRLAAEQASASTAKSEWARTAGDNLMSRLEDITGGFPVDARAGMRGLAGAQAEKFLRSIEDQIGAGMLAKMIAQRPDDLHQAFADHQDATGMTADAKRRMDRIHAKWLERDRTAVSGLAAVDPRILPAVAESEASIMKQLDADIAAIEARPSRHFPKKKGGK